MSDSNKCTKCHGLGYYDEGHENDDGSMSGGNYVECEKCATPAKKPIGWATTGQLTRGVFLVGEHRGKDFDGLMPIFLAATGNQPDDLADLLASIKDKQQRTEELESQMQGLSNEINDFQNTIETLKGEQTVMVNLMMRALRVIETIESEDSDEESEMTQLKGHMENLINQSISSLMRVQNEKL